MEEIWKDIPGYEGMYQVSNMGEVRSLSWTSSREPRILKKSIVSGYYSVTLQLDGKGKNYKVHRLVMLAFYGESPKVVNHKDGNKLNNNINNLEYVWQKENIDHAWDNGLVRRPTGKKAPKLTDDQVRYIRGSNKMTKELAEELGVQDGIISNVRNYRSYKRIK